jgi:hypothetical protein
MSGAFVFFSCLVAFVLGISGKTYQEARDSYGEKELAGADDPSYASVARHFPPLLHPREAVGVPSHPQDIGVRDDGSLELSDDVDQPDARLIQFAVGEPLLPFASVRSRVKRRLVEGWIPAVIITFREGDMEYEETIFGHSEGFKTNASLWAYIRFSARNLGQSARRTAVGITMQPGDDKQTLWRISLSAGAAGTVCFRIPYDLQRGDALEEISEQAFKAVQSEVVSFWKGWIARGSDFSLPEVMLADAWKAWLCFSSLNVDEREGRNEAHDGIGFYEEIYGYSAALYAHALDLWGRPDEAEDVLAALLSFQSKEGLYTQNYGLPDHGALLFALAEHFRLTKKIGWLRAVSPRVESAAEWIIRQREEARRLRPDRNGLTYGLIRFRPYCDHRDPVFDYYADAYTCRGLEEAAAVFNEIDTEKARRFSAEASEYRRDILASMDRAVIERDGMNILPLEPDTHRLLKSTGYRGGGYYGLVASMLLESGFLPPDDKRAFWVTDFMERRGGLILGLCEFDGGIDHAYTYGYLLTQLQRDEVRRTLLGFYSFLAYGMSRDSYSGVECTQIKTGKNTMTLPHLYSATQQLRLLRMLLLREAGDGLLLAYGMPAAWLEAGSAISVRNAPTHFGRISFEIRGNLGSREATANVVPPPGRPRIRLRLRTPLGWPLTSVTVDVREWKQFKKDVVDLGRPSGRISVRVSYQKP